MINTGGVYGIKYFNAPEFLYIGQTKNNFIFRWAQHLTNIKNNSLELEWYQYEKENLNNLDFIILYDCRKAPVLDLNLIEENFIKQYQPKYNIRSNPRYQNNKKELINKKISELLKQYEGILLLKEEQTEIITKCKEIGLTNAKRAQDYSFPFLKKYCEENNICKFEGKKKKIQGKSFRGWVISF